MARTLNPKPILVSSAQHELPMLPMYLTAEDVRSKGVYVGFVELCTFKGLRALRGLEGLQGFRVHSVCMGAWGLLAGA